MKSGTPTPATWRRLRRNRVVLLVVAVLAAVFSVASSPAEVTFEDAGASGTFMLSSDDPTASVFYRVGASDAVSSAWQKGANFTFSAVTLDPALRSTVSVYLNETEVELSESRLTMGCGQCYEDGDSYTFEFEGGAAPVIVHWSVVPWASFEGDEPPKDAALELEASSTGQGTPATWIDGGQPNGASWERNLVSAMTRTPVAMGTEAWLVYTGGWDSILVGPSPDRVGVAPGGAVPVPIPAQCRIGPCIIESEIMMNHPVFWALALVGDGGVVAPLSVDRQVRGFFWGTIEHDIDVGPGESVTFDLHATVRGLDPGLVSVVQPRMSVARAVDRRDSSERPGYLSCGSTDCGGNTMSCDGSVCRHTIPVTFTAYDDKPVQDTLVLRVSVTYDHEVPIELEIDP